MPDNKGRDYFRKLVNKFFLNGVEHYLFVKSQWESQEFLRPHLYFLIYRWAACCTMVGIWIYSMIDHSLNHPIGFWFIYLTHWGLFLQCVYFGYSAGLVTQAWSTQGNEIETNACSKDQHLPLKYKIMWSLCSISSTVAFGITGGYWAVIYDPVTHAVTAVNVLIHVVNSVCVVIDIFVSAVPWRVAHFLHPFLLAVVYFAFSGIYFVSGGTDSKGSKRIYNILDWEHPAGIVIILCAGFIVVLGLHSFLCGLYTLRKAVYLYKRRGNLTLQAHQNFAMDLDHMERSCHQQSKVSPTEDKKSLEKTIINVPAQNMNGFDNHAMDTFNHKTPNGLHNSPDTHTAPS